MIQAKAVITIDFDAEGQARATVVFDPPLPDRPTTPEEEEKWLEQVPAPQLAGILVMDQIMDVLGDDLEVNNVSVVGPGNETRH